MSGDALHKSLQADASLLDEVIAKTIPLYILYKRTDVLPKPRIAPNDAMCFLLPKRCLSGNGGTKQAGKWVYNTLCSHTKSWKRLRTCSFYRIPV